MHGKLITETPPDAFYRKYMGGSAMGVYYILKEMPRGADALAPENVLAVMTSVTTGAAISGQSLCQCECKIPDQRRYWRFPGWRLFSCGIKIFRI